MAIFRNPIRGELAEPWARTNVEPTLSQGRASLNVAGESHYQDHLWRIVGGRQTNRITHNVVAILVPEPKNLYDPNAIAILINGEIAGYVPAHLATLFLPGLKALARRANRPVGMRGAICGGGIRGDGIGLLGVFLRYEPTDFGLPPERPSDPVRMQTGAASATSIGRLEWLVTLSPDSVKAIKQLRALLDNESDSVERHFMYHELETRLYKAREVYPTALDDYDNVVVRHNIEMDIIRSILLEEFGEIPVLDIYKQCAIRQ
jgi:hypothetical protein